MTKTRTVTRFIIALCPATPIYLAAPSREPEGAVTRVKDDACRFDTFDAAMEVAKRITNWGGAQRVEEVAVEVEDPRVTLDTPEARIEVRDAATYAWHEANERDELPTAAAVQAIRDLGCKAYSEDGNTVYISDHRGNLLTLEWDPMQDGFSYEKEGDDACDLAEDEAQHEDEPDTVASFPERSTIDMDPARTHWVRIEGDFDAICDLLGDAVGTKIDAFEVLKGGAAPHTEKNAGAESGTEPIFRALLGLTTEQKIVALANALLAAQTTIYRTEEDGNPIIRAILPNYHPHFGTVTVLNI
jgi:hypothetical protein